MGRWDQESSCEASCATSEQLDEAHPRCCQEGVRSWWLDLKGFTGLLERLIVSVLWCCCWMVLITIAPGAPNSRRVHSTSHRSLQNDRKKYTVYRVVLQDNETELHLKYKLLIVRHVCMKIELYILSMTPADPWDMHPESQTRHGKVTLVADSNGQLTNASVSSKL